jgi:hypothetical protein
MGWSWTTTKEWLCFLSLFQTGAGEQWRLFHWHLYWIKRQFVLIVVLFVLTPDRTSILLVL